MTTQYAAPIIVTNDGNTQVLQQLSFSSTGEYNEAWLQETIFSRPDCLPAAEIDSAFRDLIPVCTELRTAVGRLDILFVTPSGRLALVETKLWRNPEARREVVGQVLDYVATVSTWQYKNLDDAVRQRTGKSLYDVVSGHEQGIEEAAFIDNVIRSLRDGRFLLMVCGDGIREEVQDISDFISRNATLDFSFGLVEMPVFRIGATDKLILPRILARTFTFRRQVLTLDNNTGLRIGDSSGPDSETGSRFDDEKEKQRSFWQNFWRGVDESLSINAKNYGELKHDRRNWTSFVFEDVDLWFTVYLAESSNRIGIFLKEPTDSAPEAARRVYEALSIDHDGMVDAITVNAEGTMLVTDSRPFSWTRSYLNPFDENERADARQWIAAALNVLAEELGSEIRRLTDEL